MEGINLQDFALIICICGKKTVILQPEKMKRINLTACDLYKRMLKLVPQASNSRLVDFLYLFENELLIYIRECQRRTPRQSG